jgi:hypothetical protein
MYLEPGECKPCSKEIVNWSNFCLSGLELGRIIKDSDEIKFNQSYTTGNKLLMSYPMVLLYPGRTNPLTLQVFVLYLYCCS